jgi:hypothetical protein
VTSFAKFEPATRMVAIGRKRQFEAGWRNDAIDPKLTLFARARYRRFELRSSERNATRALCSLGAIVEMSFVSVGLLGNKNGGGSAGVGV